MKKKFFAIISVLLFVLLPVSVNADMGPKPSVQIRFEGLSDEECYGTLLSQQPTSLFAGVWDGTEEDARHSGNSEWYDTPEDVWRAFVEYKDADGFYYLQETWNCGETGTLNWTYFPPETFKVLLYFPEHEMFAVSDICESYAFHSYYTVDASAFTEGKLTVSKSYEYTGEIVSFLARFCITVALEVAIAFCFGFRSKHALSVLISVNFITQLLLNALLSVVGFKGGAFALILLYILLELLVTVYELVWYYFALCSKTDISFIRITLYTLVANFVSFNAGILIALIVPSMF